MGEGSGQGKREGELRRDDGRSTVENLQYGKTGVMVDRGKSLIPCRAALKECVNGPWAARIFLHAYSRGHEMFLKIIISNES